MLEGHWMGTGTVMVNGRSIPYLEDLLLKVIRQSPDVVMNVQQYTKHAQNGNPMHAENGFMKIFPNK